MKPGTVGVISVAVALAAGGLFIGLGGLSDDAGSAASVPRATLPASTVAPPAPAVIGSEPAGSSTTDPDTTIPDGVETLPVPNVIGTNQSTAEARLRDFAVDVTTVTATEARFIDAISDQEPAAAERLPAGATVSITLSIQPVPETIPADPIPVGQFTAVDLSDLDVGECGNASLVGDQLVYARVECEEFHDLQLILRFDLEDAPADFDELALDELIREQCEQTFEDFVGLSARDSSLSLQTVRPNPERYVSEGERTSACAVIPDRDVRVQGSAEGSLW